MQSTLSTEDLGDQSSQKCVVTQNFVPAHVKVLSPGTDRADLMDIFEELLLLLVIQRVGMRHIVQRFLRLQGREDNVILSLHLCTQCLGFCWLFRT